MPRIGWPLFDFVLRKIVGGDQAAALLDGRGQLARHRAMVEVVRIFGDALKRLGQLRLLEDVALPVVIAIALKDAMRFGKLRQVGIVERFRFLVVEDVAIARQSDRRLHHLLQRQLAPVLLRIHQTRYGAGNANRFVAQHAQVWNHIALGVEIHVGGGFGRGFLAEVEEVDLAVGAAEEQKAATADIARLGKHHSERETDGDGRIYGIAALLHDRDSRLGRIRLHRGHHGLRRMHGVHPIAGDSRDAQRQRDYRVQKLAS